MGIVDRSVQVNNGLMESAACASTVVYDGAYGLVFLVYMTGNRFSYGESTGKIRLSVFSPTQPANARFRKIDEGVGESRGFLCTCAWSLGPGKIRILFTTTKGELGAYTRDYDFESDTVSPRQEVFLRVGEKLLPTVNESYKALSASYGHTDVSDAPPILNKAWCRDGEVYTALTLDGPSYPILCRVRENVLEPFAFCPVKGTYEFRYYLDDTGIHGVFRHPVDDTGTGKTGYAFSGDGGKTWKSEIFPDGIQSRPDILPYDGKPLIIYNYLSDRSHENFPPMHNHRNAVKLMHDGKILWNFYEKYGIVEHTTVNICGDLYMAFSTCEQALSVLSGTAWIEEGRPVEQGKEEIRWVKLGYPA